jgi:hypothetical protein
MVVNRVTSKSLVSLLPHRNVTTQELPLKKREKWLCQFYLLAQEMFSFQIPQLDACDKKIKHHCDEVHLFVNDRFMHATTTRDSKELYVIYYPCRKEEIPVLKQVTTGLKQNWKL